MKTEPHNLPQGHDEMILQVTPDDVVGFANAAMATLLGLADRRELIGQPLLAFDGTDVGPGVLTSLVQLGRSSHDGTYQEERRCPALPAERLPSGERPPGEPVLHFTVSRLKGHVQVVARDVTRQRWVEQSFSRVVSSKMLEQLVAMPVSRLLGMQRREATVLVAGFSYPVAEAAAAEALMRATSECVELLDGAVCRFSGEALTVVFGAPVEQVDHALRALLFAVELQKRLGRGQLDVGVATGEALAGPLAGAYAALGAPVNLATRLCDAASGGQVLTVPQTHALAIETAPQYSGRVLVPRLSFRPNGPASFKHVEQPVEVIEVLVR